MTMNEQDYISYLDSRRGKIITSKGGWRIGKGVTSHNYSLLDELVGEAGFFQVLVLNITGKLPEKRLTQWLEATFICLSWPDPRIWCNQIGSFGGSLRTSPVAGICAGIMASDSSIYGPGTVIPATRFIRSAVKFIEQGGTVPEFIRQKAVTRLGLQAPGYARPIAKGDERVSAMTRVAEKLGYTEGKHIKTAFQIEQYLLEKYGESINLAGYIMAFLSDQGFDEDSIHRLYSLCVNGGIHACYSEAYDSPKDSFQPLRCKDIEYTGIPARTLS